MKLTLALNLAIVLLTLSSAQAAKENPGAKAIKKLQMMVKEASAEKERLSAENAKLAAELEDLKTQLEQGKKDNAGLETKQKKLTAEVDYQKKATEVMRGRLDAATTRIHEVIDKFNALNQAKNELMMEHEQLKNSQQFTSSELKRCEANNIKMYEGAKSIIGGYEKCQKKGLIDTVMGTEPFTQIKSVEFENLVQEYEDKLRKQKFQKTEVKAEASAPETAPPNQSQPAGSPGQQVPAAK